MISVAEKFVEPLDNLPDDFKPIGAIFYCDGGFRSNQYGEAAGWGVHGYYYDQEERKAGYGLKNCDPTDYGYMGPAIALVDDKGKALRVSHTGKLEEAVKVRILKYVNAYGNVLEAGTNNVAELRALLHAMHIAYHSPDSIKRVRFILDSMYVLDGCLKYMDAWIKRDWKKAGGEVVANVDYWKAINEMIEKLKYIGVALEWDWVKGHSDDIGNKSADELATRGIYAGYNHIERSSLELSDISKYWTPVADVPEMAKEPRFYIRLGGESTKMSGHVYHFGNQGSKDEALGVPSADKMYCVIRSNEPFEVHAALKQIQEQKSNGLACLSEVRNDVLLKPRIYNDIESYQGDHLIASKKGDILLPSDEILASLQWPALLSLQADKRLEWLENLLEAYLCGEMDDSYIFYLNDITDQVYSKVEDKKGKVSLKFNKTNTLKPEVVIRDKNGLRNARPTLIYGRDLPRHTVLTGVADQNPTIFVLTWPDSAVSARFATILTTDKADGIWCAVYANYVFTLNPATDDTK